MIWRSMLLLTLLMQASCIGDSAPRSCLSCAHACLENTRDEGAKVCGIYGVAVYIDPADEPPQGCGRAGTTPLGVDRYCCRYTPSNCLPITNSNDPGR